MRLNVWVLNINLIRLDVYIKRKKKENDVILQCITNAVTFTVQVRAVYTIDAVCKPIL